jgi:ubiquinone/menaquinone biosynthesis C-methylase UbiE
MSQKLRRFIMFYDSFANQKRNKYGKIIVGKTFEKLAKTVASYSPITILEVGIGQGIFYEKLKKEIPQMEYTGIEAGDTLYEEAKEKGINVVKCFVPPFPEELERGGFDMVVMSHVLEHFIDYREVLEVLTGINGLLKPNGKLLLFHPCARDCGFIDFFDAEYSHSYVTTRNRVDNLLYDSGFQVIKRDSYRACFTNFKAFFCILSKILNLCTFMYIKTRSTFSKNLLTVAEKNS